MVITYKKFITDVDYDPKIRLQTISALITAMGRPAPGVVDAPT